MNFQTAMKRNSLGANIVEKKLSDLQEVAATVHSRLNAGGKLIICGNGGSAADAQHFAAELTGRFEKNRKALPAIALTTDTSALTAIGNDFGFDQIFSRQVEALAKPEDTVFVISTSGNSLNCCLAVDKAQEIGCFTVSLTGRDGGKLKGITDLNFNVELEWTRHVQEWHIFVIHCICEYLEADY